MLLTIAAGMQTIYQKHFVTNIIPHVVHFLAAATLL
jgi:hypothetical protein